MAYTRRTNRTRKRPVRARRRRSKYTNAEKFAYHMGCVDRGVKNPNSRVHASYKNGLTGTSTTKKKPLY